MKTVLHVGFHKTGTKTLQGQFFPRLPGTAVLAPVPGGERFVSLARQLCEADEGSYTGEALRALFASAASGFDRLVVSHENFSGRREGDRTAQRLHALLPDASVLIVVREQRALLYSRYVGWISRGGSASFARFLTTLDPAWLEFDEAVEQYQRIFGVERVKVLLYELLASDPERYLAELRAFVAPGEALPAEEIALPFANRALAPPMRLAVRGLNRLFVRRDENPWPPLGWIPHGRGLAQRLARFDPWIFPNMQRTPGRRAQYLAERYALRYAAGNARLERLLGVSLSSYGYLLSDGG